MVPLLTYREQFQDMKGRIDKCEARRADYDRCNDYVAFEAVYNHDDIDDNGEDESNLKMCSEPSSWQRSWR